MHCDMFSDPSDFHSFKVKHSSSIFEKFKGGLSVYKFPTDMGRKIKKQSFEIQSHMGPIPHPSVHSGPNNFYNSPE